MSLIGMIVTLAIAGVVVYVYLSKNKQTGTIQYEDNRAVIDAAEEAKRMIESRQVE